jgi:superoxide reductase
MTSIAELYQSADWKAEKHVPVIEAPDAVRKNELLQISVVVGKEVPHPNKTEHHIRWVAVYFRPEGERYPCQLSRVEFASHGESTKGPDTSGIYTEPRVTVQFKTEKPGTIYASSFCNIHGLWESRKELQVT